MVTGSRIRQDGGGKDKESSLKGKEHDGWKFPTDGMNICNIV